MIARSILLSLTIALLGAAPPASAAPAADAALVGVSAPITFSDGAVATAYPHCGDTDLCATIAYRDGDTLRMYSEGAAACQPYVVHFVMLGPTKANIYEFSRALRRIGECTGEEKTEFTMDHGAIHLDVTQNPDGTLLFTFAPTPPPAA
jgi:hypothetical protein